MIYNTFVKVYYHYAVRLYLIIGENDFQLKKEKTKYYYTYSLSNAAVFDVSDKDVLKIMVSSSKYKIFIRP